MNERYKIGEARFFLARMEESIRDRVAFRYNLSAFLSAAQSVLQYALTESDGKGNRKWYDENVAQINDAQNNVLRDFKEKRDANTHRGEPVDPARDVTIAISEGVMVLSAVGEVRFNDKPAEMMKPKEEPPPPKSSESRHRDMVLYRFVDWPGSEDLNGLSRRYIEELEKFVQKGMEEGIISG